MIKIVVAGSRDFEDYEMLHDKLKHLTRNHNNTELEIVSGTARGADKLGEQYAEQYNIKLTKFPADWSLGKSAGYKRNVQMAHYADVAVVFQVDHSKGSQHMIDIMRALHKKVIVIQITARQL